MGYLSTLGEDQGFGDSACLYLIHEWKHLGRLVRQTSIGHTHTTSGANEDDAYLFRVERLLDSSIARLTHLQAEENLHII